jgi:hypothetical protein
MLLAVIAAASLHAQITDVGLSSADVHSALRMSLSGARRDGVVVRREGDLTRVSLKRTRLGRSFSGGDLFQWRWAPGPEWTGPRRPHCPEAVWIERGRDEVTVSFRLPPDVSVESRQNASAVLLVFRQPPTAEPVQVARSVVAPARSVVVPMEAPVVPAARIEPSEVAVKKDPTPDRELLVGQLLGTLPGPGVVMPADSSPAVAVARADAAAEDSDALYRRLFPHGAPAAPESKKPPREEGGATTSGDRTFRFGFLTFDPALRFAFMDARSSFSTSTSTSRDRYWEIRPGLGVSSRLWQGRLRAEYEPALRAFGSFGATRSTSHRARATLDVAPGRRTQVVLQDAFATGVLEAGEVDPGGEYFFDLRRFSRNAVGLTARHDLTPRWRLEAGGGLNQVRFKNDGAFFDHDTRTVNLGVGYELTPKSRVSLTWVRDRVPRTDERPEAESTAHGVQAAIHSQPEPRLLLQAMLGLREQSHPSASEEGQRYRGLVLGGSLVRMLGLSSSVAFSGNRSVLLSAFEGNGFYVTTQLQGDVSFRVPYGFTLDAGAGHRWNEYPVAAAEIGVPRDDAVFDWGGGVRKLIRWGTVGIHYRRQRRSSNIDRFDTSTDRLVLQLDFDLLRAAGLR